LGAKNGQYSSPPKSALGTPRNEKPCSADRAPPGGCQLWLHRGRAPAPARASALLRCKYGHANRPGGRAAGPPPGAPQAKSSSDAACRTPRPGSSPQGSGTQHDPSVGAQGPFGSGGSDCGSGPAAGAAVRAAGPSPAVPGPKRRQPAPPPCAPSPVAGANNRGTHRPAPGPAGRVVACSQGA
jgi:hypothetical protein